MYFHAPHADLVTRPRGFTLVELMAATAILAILGTLAVPSLRSFMVRNTLSGLGNEFSGSILRARTEAVSRNICTTMCLSNTVDAATPFCKQSGKDWQVGWIVFLNPSCDSDYGKNAKSQAVAAADLLLVRRPGDADYHLLANTSTRRIQFNARGNNGMGSIDRFDLTYADDVMTAQSGFRICLDKMGRTRSIPATATCSG